MKKLFHYLALAFLLIGFGRSTYATHVVGAEITYQYIGNDSFKLKLVVYRDCQGIQLANTSIKVQTSCSTFTVGLNRDTVFDVTGFSPHCVSQSRCSSSNGPYGFEKHIFTGVFKMPSDSCCNYLFSWETCCRNVAINTGSSNAPYYTETKYNKCLAPKNSSPAAINDPKLLVGVGERQSILYTSLDFIDNDSVSYELAYPLTDSGVNATYAHLFSPQRPLTFPGFPNASLPFPSGFHLNASTGELRFLPILKSQVTVFGIKISEWRKINGKYEKIGEILRDTELWVITDTSSDPIIDKSNQTLAICNTLGTSCQTIPVYSNNTSDTVSFNFISNSQNITVKNLNISPSRTAAKVCIKVDSTLLKDPKKTTFILQANTNGCPLNKSIFKAFSFDVKPQLPDSFGINLKFSKCRNVTASLANNSSIDSTILLWKMWNSKDTVATVGDTAITVNFQDSGWVYTSLKVFSENHCSGREYKDSIYIDSKRYFQVSLGQDRVSCFKQTDTLQLSDTLKKGVIPYSYKWSVNNGDTNSTVIFNTVLGIRKIWVKVTDANGCTSSDTITVGSYAPSVSIIAPTQVCENTVFGTKATISQAIQPVYEWVGFTKNDPFLVDSPATSRSYRFILEDAFGCKVDTSISINVINIDVSISGDTSYCPYDTVNLSASITGGLAPTQTTWQPNSVSGTSLQILPTHSTGNRQIAVKVKDNFGCEDSAFQNIVVNPLPNITITSSGPYCEVDNDINLTAQASPKGGIWFGQGIVNDSTFSPQMAILGTNTIAYLYVDSATSCADTSSTQINVVRQEKANFVALKTIGVPNDTIDFINTTPNASSLSNRWDLGDFGKSNNIQLTTNASYKYVDTGKYTVKLWVKNTICPPDSIIKTAYIKIGNVNLSNLKISATNVSIYPNPAKDYISIEADETLESINIYSTTGKKILPTIINNGKFNTVNTSALKEGIYIIELKFNNGYVLTKKVSINR